MLVFADSFDHYGTAQLPRRWTSVLGTGHAIGSSSPAAATGVGRVAIPAGSALGVLNPNGSHGAGEAHFWFQRVTGVEGDLAVVLDGTAVHLTLNVSAGGTLRVYRGTSTGGTLLASSTVALTATYPYHVRWTWAISTSAGATAVFASLRGSQTVGAINIASVNTRNGAATWNAFALAPSGHTTYYEDVILLDDDTAGANSLTALEGVQQVVGTPASPGNGGSAAWVPSTGADHGAMVDEATPDDDTTFNETNAVGAEDTYVFAPPAAAVIHGVQVVNCVREGDEQGREIVALARVGSTNYEGTPHVVDRDFRFYAHLFPVNPATGNPWTADTAAQFGVKHESEGSGPLTAAPEITSAGTVTFTEGQDSAFTIVATGTPTPTLSRLGDALPSGVTFTPHGDGTATLAGIPAGGTADTYAFTIRATNSAGTDDEALTLTVEAPADTEPVITSEGTAYFEEGVAAAFLVTTTGHPSPTIVRTGDALPTGLSFVDHGDGTATLSGTPAAATAGDYDFTITATNTEGEHVASLVLVVQPAGTGDIAPEITSAGATTFAETEAGTFTVTASGLPTPTIVRTGAGLPAGLTFTDHGNGTATLSGTPASGTAGSYTFTITATNSEGSDVESLTLTIEEDAPTVPGSDGGIFENATVTSNRPWMSGAAAGVPSGRGTYITAAPYGTRAYRITDPAIDCAGGDCISGAIYANWPLINNHGASNTLYAMFTARASRGGTGPNLVSINKTTHAITHHGALFGSSDSRRLSSGENYYFSKRLPTKLYMGQGSTRLIRHDILTHTDETVFDVSSAAGVAAFGSGRYIWQCSSSYEDALGRGVHAFTVRASSGFAMLGGGVYSEITGQYQFFPAAGAWNECRIDHTGQWLVARQAIAPSSADDARYYDLSDGSYVDHFDADHAPGHYDMGQGCLIGRDNFSTPPPSKLWNFGTDPPGPGTVMTSDPTWARSSGTHISWTQAWRHARTSSYAVASDMKTLAQIAANGGRGHEIFAFRTDGSRDLCILSPNMVDPETTSELGDNYRQMPKAYMDPIGQYVGFGSNLGGNFQNILIVKVPSAWSGA